MLKIALCLLGILCNSTVWCMETPTAAVQTQILSLRPIATVINCFGMINISPAAMSHVTTPIPGQIVNILVQKAQHVNKDQHLLTLRPDPAVMQSYVQARNQEVLARQELVQQQQLLAAQLTTQNDVDRAQQNLKSAEVAVRTLKMQGADQSLITVNAPRSGLISLLNLVAGDHVDANTTLLGIGNEQKLQAIVQVDPEDAEKITAGMKVRLGDVFSVVQNLTGSVDLVEHQVDPRTRKVNVLVQLKQGSVLEGTAVRARITIASQDLLAVPHAAILQDNVGNFIYRVSNGHAHRVNVNIGHEENGWVAISGDLDPGQHIVVLGNYELQDGMAVKEEVLP